MTAGALSTLSHIQNDYPSPSAMIMNDENELIMNKHEPIVNI